MTWPLPTDNMPKKQSHSPEARARRRVRNATKRRATLGRQCSPCLINDSEVIWGDGPLCAACVNSCRRNGACKCGRPLRKVKRGRTRHIALCSTCDGDAFIAMGYRMIILLAPNDDRERRIWRSRGRRYKVQPEDQWRRGPTIITATEDQWRQLR